MGAGRSPSRGRGAAWASPATTSPPSSRHCSSTSGRAPVHGLPLPSRGPACGEFSLQHCGALLDVEPSAEKQVPDVHAIEDPTFDATAAATNPCAIRPIHRPPRVPPDACRTATGRSSSMRERPLRAARESRTASRSRMAGVAIDVPPSDAEPGGGRMPAGRSTPSSSSRTSRTGPWSCRPEFACRAT